MTVRISRVALLLFVLAGFTAPSRAQLDPESRRLIQFGYNQHLQGHGPVAGYGFYYYNNPDFIRTNLTLRLAVAPVYLDSDLGFKSLLGANTDLSVGLAGGGFADTYSEIRRGVYYQDESFFGHSAEASLNAYHLFNPGDEIPLWGIVRGIYHYSIYERENTSPDFKLPPDRSTGILRVGFRFGGESPNMNAPLAMELSAFYEPQIRSDDGVYGFGDREVRPISHLAWARGLLKYTFEPSQQWMQLSLTAGTSRDADRFSAYRLGSLLPFSSDLPLNLPGYYFGEISARNFALLDAQYAVPIDPGKHWEFTAYGAAAAVDYLPGLEQPGNLHNGAGAGFTWLSPTTSWLISLLYGHGFEAIRSHGRGADSLVFLLQYDFYAKPTHPNRFFQWLNPYKSHGGEEIFH